MATLCAPCGEVGERVAELLARCPPLQVQLAGAIVPPVKLRPKEIKSRCSRLAVPAEGNHPALGGGQLKSELAQTMFQPHELLWAQQACYRDVFVDVFPMDTYPSPMNSHSFLCFSVAFSSRGNHTRGTDTVRPSSNTTVIASLEQDTSTATASLLATKVGIPTLQEKSSIFADDLTNDRQLMTAKPGSMPDSPDQARTSHNVRHAQHAYEAARDPPNCKKRIDTHEP